jgi:biopolymer transport protein ExbD/biopolymer transport protein TolR
VADLGPKVNDLLQNKTTKQIFLRADARSKYGTVMETIDNVRTAGVDQLGVLTEQPNVNAGAGGVQ